MPNPIPPQPDPNAAQLQGTPTSPNWAVESPTADSTIRDTTTGVALPTMNATPPPDTANQYIRFLTWLNSQINNEWSRYTVHQYNDNSIRHYPPAKEPTANIMLPVTATGIRGLAVRNLLTPLISQPCRLTWVGLDIDSDDNHPYYQHSAPNDANGRPRSPYEFNLFNKVKVVLGDKWGVRLSKGGQGVHCFMRIKDAPEMTYDKARAIARLVVQPAVTMLKTHNIHCCVTGLPNLWVHSTHGKQATLITPDYCHDVSDLMASSSPTWATPPEAGTRLFDLSSFGSEQLTKIVVTLCKKGILSTPPSSKTNVNIAQVKLALAGQVDMVTRAKGRPGHEHEPNGFIELTPDGISVVSNADNNKCIFRMQDL